MTYKLGSLFDGSGGFPLAGALCGIEPVWAAEVEPYPIAVTRSRFPKMKHLGDISKVNGAQIEPVDIITFGSPCQDLSVAGKRAGLKHEANGDEETTRSGLFMEAVRIIKEMRNATDGKYPRFALWENVPGAFSSNKGEDFRVVCEELIKIVEPSAFMPEVPKNGWNYSDSYIGDGWSLSYRVLDAQYWGVPQRRRRIYLVADFRGECAHQVLFEREGLRGYFAQGRTPWQTTPADAQGCLGADDREGEATRGQDGVLDAVGVINAIGGNAENSQETDTFPTLTNGTAPGFNNAVAVPYTMKVRSSCDIDANGKAAEKSALIQVNKSATLATINDQYLFQPIGDTHIIDNVGGQAEYAKASEVNGTLRAGAQGLVAYAVENHPADSRVNVDESGKVQTLTSRMGTGGGNVPMVMEQKEPVICLQGNGIDRADSAGCNGKGWREDVSYTLNTIDRPAVVVNAIGGNAENSKVTETFPTLTNGSAPDFGNAVAYGLDRASFNQGQNAKFDFTVAEEQQPTLTARGPDAVCVADHPTPKIDENGVAYTLNARDYKAPVCVAYPVDYGKTYQQTTGPLMTNSHPGSYSGQDAYTDMFVVGGTTPPPHYIVRRLTPTECARLQGFADWWGYLEAVNSLSQKDYQFWLEVRNTHAVINGKKEQDYTPKQMLNWYNRLWTDSAEYKMWGNGIALPTALYVVQGIADALTKVEDDPDDWML